MTRRVRLKSLAKINLDLRVLHRNPDGFHELRTVFHTISLADSIDIEYEPSRRTQIELDDPAGIPDNLIVCAAKAALDAMRHTARVRFRLVKNIPMGAGLGGGSSNAAAVLIALPALAGRALPQAPKIAASLGSDVPFFLMGGAALGLGRGTELYPLPDLKPEPLLLACSGVHVATGKAYQDLRRGPNFADYAPRIERFQTYVSALQRERSAASAGALSANDFEPVVFRHYPRLRAIRTKLGIGGATARMTGSGSAVFALFASAEERELAAAELRKDRMFRECRLIPTTLVSRGRYQALWRRALEPSAPI